MVGLGFSGFSLIPCTNVGPFVISFFPENTKKVSLRSSWIWMIDFEHFLKVECKSHPRTNSRVPWGAVELCCFEKISWACMVKILVRYWLRIRSRRFTVNPRLSQHLSIECLPLIANTEFKSEGYSRLSFRITWPLLLLIGGGKMVEFIAINGRDKLQ